MMLDLAGLAEDLRRITVEVTDQPDQALGSGVLWPPGYVVTNAHVVRRPRVTLQLVDGRRLTGELLARDADADLALIRAPGAGLPVENHGAPDDAWHGTVVVTLSPHCRIAT